MTTKRKALPLRRVVTQSKTFVARLVLADLIAKRGDGPLERKQLVYGPRKR
jgi:hypothetical protein